VRWREELEEPPHVKDPLYVGWERSSWVIRVEKRREESQDSVAVRAQTHCKEAFSD
jgi:hypothetical protein